jgi:EAL domain-containing protein (putative c-di-GMP-specific phosphodiesterase class I)
MAEWGVAAHKKDDHDTTEESLLLDRLNRIQKNATGCFGVHVHLSALRPNNKQPHFIEIAARSCDNLVDSSDTTLFSLTNKDLVLICHDVPVDDVDLVMEKIRGLFSEDPLTEINDAAFEDKFSTWYDLSGPEDFADFFAVITELAVEAEQYAKELARQRDQLKEKGEPLQPSNLTEINRKLVGIRIADMIKRQACLQVGSGGDDGELIFYELFISMADIRERVAPDINLFASPWLFQYLTETLDRRLLSVLVEEEFDELQEALSINLNVSTVLSRDFQNLHRAVGENAHKIVVEFQIIDIFSDMKSYAYARDSLQERGYRVVVDGLNPLSLQYFDPAGLQSDFIKIAWGPEFTGDEEDRRVDEMREVIATAGKETMILGRVDSEKAVKWGLGLGISRFQGFCIDKLVQVIGRGKRAPAG